MCNFIRIVCVRFFIAEEFRFMVVVILHTYDGVVYRKQGCFAAFTVSAAPPMFLGALIGNLTGSVPVPLHVDLSVTQIGPREVIRWHCKQTNQLNYFIVTFSNSLS